MESLWLFVVIPTRGESEGALFSGGAGGVACPSPKIDGEEQLTPSAHPENAPCRGEISMATAEPTLECQSTPANFKPCSRRLTWPARGRLDARFHSRTGATIRRPGGRARRAGTTLQPVPTRPIAHDH